MIKKGLKVQKPLNLYVGRKYSPIVALMRRKKLTYTDVSRALCVGTRTLREYIDNPLTMRLHNIMLLAGLFGMDVEVLTYLLIRNKPMVGKYDKKQLENLKKQSKAYLNEFESISFLD